MKKIKQLFIVLFSVCISGGLLAQTAPYSETFDATSTPTGWTLSATSGGPWVFGTPGFTWNNTGCSGSTPADHTGNGGNYAAMDHSTTDVGVIMEMPVIDVSALTTPFLDFYHQMCGSGYSPLNETYIEASDGAGGWTQVALINTGTGVWENYGFDLSAFTYGANLVQLRFRTESGGSSSDFYGDIAIDDVSIVEAPSCIAPSSPTSSATSSSADLGWTDNAGASSWAIEYGASGFTQGTGTTVVTSSNPHTVTGLTDNTAYDFYVRAICAPGDSSAWVGPTSFTTPCNPYTIPHTESFESGYTYNTDIDGCISQESVTGSNNWTANDGSVTTYNRTPRTGNWSAFLRYSNEDWLFIPVALTGGTSYTAEVYAKQDGTTTTNSDVGLSYGSTNTAAGMTNTIVAPVGIDDNYQQIQGTFTPASTGTYYIGIKGFMNSSPWYITIDDFSIIETPACPPPSSLMASGLSATTADLGWTENGTATSWEVEYGTSGFTQGMGTKMVVGSNPTTITGLTATTGYDFYVRSICAPGDTSVWSSAGSFTTTCVALTNFVQDFEDGGTLDPCWEIIDPSSGSSFSNTTYSVSGSRSRYLYNSFNYEIGIASQELSNLSAGTHRLSFWAYTTDTDPASVRVGTVDGADIFSEIITVNLSAPNTWEQFFVNFDTYAGTDTRVMLEHGDGGTYQYIYLDDIVWEAIPSCPQPTTLTASTITVSSADLGWTEMGSATNWLIEYGPSGYTQGMGTEVLTTTNPHSLSGLMSNTDYDFYVRSICAPGDSSVWSSAKTFRTLCSTFTAPYSQNFDGTTAPDLDPCWSTFVGTTTASAFARTATSPNNSAPNSLELYNSSGTSGGVMAISPAFTDLDDGKRIKFQVYDDNAGSDLIIGTMSDPTDTSTFTIWQTITEAEMDNDAWEEFIVEFTGYSGSDQHIVFRHGMNGTFDYLNIDDFVYEEIPACLEPNSMASSNVTSSSADLTWTAGGLEVNWNLEWKAGTDFAPGTGAEDGSAAVSTTPAHSLSSLTAATTYYVYYQANCGAKNGVSPWAGPFTVTTNFITPDGVNCVSGGNSSTILYHEFDAQGSWTGDFNTGNGSWQFDNNTTTSSNTGPTGPQSGTHYMFFEASGNTTLTASAVSPAIDLSAAQDEVELSFYLHAYGVGIGTFNLGVSTSPTGPFTTEFSWTGQYQTASADPWEHIAVDLTSYIGQTIYLEFEHTGAGDYYGDLAVDLLEIKSCLSCAIPSALTTANVLSSSADLGWTDASASSWEVEYGASGFTPGTGAGTVVVTGSNPYSATGLTDQTAYDFYVRAICAPGDTSGRVGPESFTTPCNTISSFPYTENFDAASQNTPPSCWENDPANGKNWEFGTSETYGAASDHTSGSGRFALIDDSSPELTTPHNLLSPFFDLTGLTTPRLSFWFQNRRTNLSNDASKLYIDVYNGSTWVMDVDSAVGDIQTWTAYIVDLTAYKSSNTQIRFRVMETTSFYSDPSLDDVTVEETPTIPNCSTLSSPADAATDVAIDADLSWSTNIDATGYKLKIGTSTGAGDFLAETDLGNVTSYDPPTDFAYATTYYVMLTAYNANGDATGCSETTFTTENDPNYGGGNASSTTGGYWWANSTSTSSANAPSAPTYNWIDPVANAHTEITAWTSGSDDDGYFTIPDIGFDFPFYGTNYRTNDAYINSNGVLIFGGTPDFNYDNAGTSNSIPSLSEVENFIAVCWMDLDDRTDGKVYYGGNANHFVVTWWHYHDYADDAEYITAQLILYTDGTFVIQYNDVESTADDLGDPNLSTTILGDALVGIENSDATKGIEYRNNGSGGPMFGSPLAVAMGTDDTKLPVELMSFTAEFDPTKGVKLDWATAIEVNNDYFTLQRSTDGARFEDVAIVDGQGTTYEPNYYSQYDVSYEPGITNYYRIKQNDFDGSFVLTEAIAFDVPGIIIPLSLVPNPAKDVVRLSFGAINDNTTINVYSVSGELLISENIGTVKGVNNHDLDINKLANGMYFVEVVNGETVRTEKLVIQK